MSEGKEWTALISFLIEVSLASDKRNSRILFKCNTLLSDITEPDDETIPYEEKFENLAKRIVNDYSIVQITHNSDYILGLSGIDKVPVVFPTKENVDSLVKIVKEVLSDKFNNDFISNFQEKEKSFLFRVNFSSVFPTHLWNVCEIDSGSVTESNEDKSNDTEDEIRFVVKVIPSNLKKPSESELETINSTIQKAIKENNLEELFKIYDLIFS